MCSKERAGGRFSNLVRKLVAPTSGVELKITVLFLLLNLIGNIPYYVYEKLYGTTERNTAWFLVVAV